MNDLKFRAYDNKAKEWLLGYEYPNLGGFSMFGECMLMGEWSAIVNRFILQQRDRTPGTHSRAELARQTRSPRPPAQRVSFHAEGPDDAVAPPTGCGALHAAHAAVGPRPPARPAGRAAAEADVP